MKTRHSRRRPFFASAAGLITVVALGWGSLPATAQPQNTSDWWFDALGVQQAHDSGLTGKGVKIAVIDDNINPDSPVFAGANLTVAPPLIPCDAPLGVDNGSHGTSVTSVIIGHATPEQPITGIAPDVELTFYATGPGHGDSAAFAQCPTSTVTREDQTMSKIGAAIDQAVADGNDIISISEASTIEGDDVMAVARAIARDVIIVAATPNSDAAIGEGLGVVTFPYLAAGVLTVGAYDEQGNLLEDNRRQDREIVAPGSNFVVPVTEADPIDWSGTSVASGTSFATPLVSGALALASQKYPDATGNQLVQSLLATTTFAGRTVDPKEARGYGAGPMDLAALLANDPSVYADEEPLLDKGAGLPAASDIAAAEAELASPSPTAEETQKTLANVLMPALIVGGIVAVLVVVGIVVAIILVVRRRPTNSP